MEEKCLLVGYARASITPPMGIHIPGHGFAPRLSDGVIDDVYVNAVAFSDGENKVIVFNCDALGALGTGTTKIRQEVAKRCGITAEDVYVACTHCHTAMWIGGNQKAEEPEGSYYVRQAEIFYETAQAALADMKPATMEIARGEVKGVGFLRRFKMKDGTLRTNPPYLHPDILDYDGVQDESLQLVRFRREGAKELLLVNFGTHPDVVGGTRYSPDWPGYVPQILKSALGDRVEVVMLNGFGGDSAHINRKAARPSVTKLEWAWLIARKISGEVLKIYDDTQPIPAGRVGGFTEIATFGKNPCEEWEIPISQQIVATGILTEKDLPEELKKYKISVKKAHRIVDNLERPDSFEVPIFGLQIGNLCMIGAPGEPFSETGMAIKAGSKMDMTICTCRTNGSQGYFPTPRAYAGGGYERDYTAFGPDCAPSIVDTALRMIGKMEKTAEPEGA